LTAHLLGFFAAGQIGNLIQVSDGGKLLETLCCGAVILKIGRGNGSVMAQRKLAVAIYQLFLRRKWKRAKQDGIYDAEDGGVRADTEREGDHGDGGEAGLFGHGAQSEPNVLNQRLHNLPQ